MFSISKSVLILAVAKLIADSRRFYGNPAHLIATTDSTILLGDCYLFVTMA
jgi:hypothetical protein